MTVPTVLFALDIGWRWSFAGSFNSIQDSPIWIRDLAPFSLAPPPRLFCSAMIWPWSRIQQRFCVSYRVLSQHCWCCFWRWWMEMDWALSTEQRGVTSRVLSKDFLLLRWIQMGSDEFRWVQMGSDGFSWVQMGSDEFRWIQMDSDWFRWI